MMSTTNPNKRFPDWKKVFVAVLEKQIEAVLGENAIDEIKQPLIQKELNEKLGSIYDAVEKQFIELVSNSEIREAVLSLPMASLPSLQLAFGEFFQQPQSDKLKLALKNQLNMDFPHFPDDQVDSAVQLYIKILHNELVPLSAEFQRMSLVYSVAQISDHTKQLDVITTLLSELLTYIKNGSTSVKSSNKQANDNSSLADVDLLKASQELQKGSMIRFLDALDSARFSSHAIYENIRLLSILYVKAQFFFTMVSGDSIVISENQFFDSLGFIETFDELYHASRKINANADLPIKVAIQKKNNNMFQVIANNIGNEKFVLSLWSDLEGNIERRKQWADSIGRKQRPDARVVLNGEKRLLDKLWTALEYFNTERCVVAQEISGEFIQRIKRVIDLQNDQIDDLYTGIREDVHGRRYFRSKSEADAAKEIRDVLIKIQQNVGEINNRSVIRRELESYGNEELKAGVIELTDGVYNQTLGIGTKAMLVQSSTFPARINKYVTAGYSMSTYLQDTSNRSNDYLNWEIFSFDYFENLEGLDDVRRKTELVSILEAAQQNTPWTKLIEMQSSPAWQASLGRFRESLLKLQAVEKNMWMGSLNTEKRQKLNTEHRHYQSDLKKNWIQHIKIVSKITSNNYWDITPTEIVFSHPDYQFSIHISYGFLKTKLDMEGDKGYQLWRDKSTFKGRMDDRFDLVG
jgi:hypothetical protein